MRQLFIRYLNAELLLGGYRYLHGGERVDVKVVHKGGVYLDLVGGDSGYLFYYLR
jgi:hypothetical protein